MNAKKYSFFKGFHDKTYILYCDISKAAQSDSLSDTVNYETVVNRVLELTKTVKVLLVESLVGKLAETILTEFPVNRVWVSVKKPEAIAASKSVCVETTRSK